MWYYWIYTIFLDAYMHFKVSTRFCFCVTKHMLKYYFPQIHRNKENGSLWSQKLRNSCFSIEENIYVMLSLAIEAYTNSLNIVYNERKKIKHFVTFFMYMWWQHTAVSHYTRFAPYILILLYDLDLHPPIF